MSHSDSPPPRIISLRVVVCPDWRIAAGYQRSW
uniref:Uncharacterized protein n=1 Tax=Arundo donax TaxID=35708 RepID=A0A0A9FYW4_ARUDO